MGAPGEEVVFTFSLRALGNRLASNDRSGAMSDWLSACVSGMAQEERRRLWRSPLGAMRRKFYHAETRGSLRDPDADERRVVAARPRLRLEDSQAFRADALRATVIA